MSKFTFVRSAGERFVFSEASMKQLEPKLIEAHSKVRELHSFVRVHPDIKEFCSVAWDEMTQRLVFDTKRSYAECSREIARRHPWVYLSRGEQGEHRSYDVDLSEVES